MSEIYIGVSGWRYGPWRKDFYPRGLCQGDLLVTEPGVEPQGTL